MSRKYTTLLLEMIESCQLDKDQVINDLCSYMSEDDVRDMMESNGYIEEEEEEV